MNLPRQVRKAVADIKATLDAIDDDPRVDRARYQLDLLSEMVSQRPQRFQPWSYYRPRAEEEFGG
ncbi:hypothetical protein FZI91_06205 [Mycobacterium sp. CBMA271]|nr:hypothetical protein [Mycobacteroides sp. CBMA 326]MUM21298.1 hypothetical protein [Mycobacteroides sp. CBMA 271]